MKNINQRIIFNFPADTTIIDIINAILKNNGLEESSQEFFNKSVRGKEPRKIIIRDVAISLIERKVPENILAYLLQKHLEISQEVAQKIIKEIKDKILPFIKKSGEDAKEDKNTSKDFPEEEKKEAFRKAKEELMKRIGAQKSIPTQEGKEAPMPYKKTPDITGVEDNARNMAKEKKPIASNNQEPLKPAPPPTQKKNNDPYKESIE